MLLYFIIVTGTNSLSRGIFIARSVIITNKHQFAGTFIYLSLINVCILCAFIFSIRILYVWLMYECMLDGFGRKKRGVRHPDLVDAAVLAVAPGIRSREDHTLHSWRKSFQLNSSPILYIGTPTNPHFVY